MTPITPIQYLYRCGKRIKSFRSCFFIAPPVRCNISPIGATLNNIIAALLVAYSVFLLRTLVVGSRQHSESIEVVLDIME